MIKRKIISAVFILAILITPLFSQTVAFMGTKNRTGAASYDYLGAIVEGVVLFDLSSIGSIKIVERQRLEEVMSEQRLQLSGFISSDASGDSLELGKILSADFLISIDYTLFGEEMAFNLYLTEPETGEVSIYSVRGSQENEIHGLSEQVARGLTGRGFNFINPAEQRNLLTLSDINPGILTLYCNLENAEIFIDDKFVGYSHGNLYQPIIIPDLDPGSYQMTIKLSQDFGMIEKPEYTFHNWIEDITIRPGRTTVHRSIVTHFNSVIYRDSELLRERQKILPEENQFTISKVLSFIDRNGHEVPLRVTISGERKEEVTEAKMVVNYRGKDIVLTSTSEGSEIEIEEGQIQCNLEIDHYTDLSQVEYEIWRTDIWQGMHRE